MKEIKYFYLRSCPYCKMADRFIDELIMENPEYADIKFEKIEERENADIADSYDYFYVPCFYSGNEKLHEGAPTKEKIRCMLSAAASDKEPVKSR